MEMHRPGERQAELHELNDVMDHEHFPAVLTSALRCVVGRGPRSADALALITACTACGHELALEYLPVAMKWA
jgi:hypothetical protein